MKLLEYSFAKINIFLDVLSPREDGYHNLQTIMAPLDWHDLIVLQEAANGEELWTTTDRNLMSIPLYELTIGKAIEKMREHRKNKKGFFLNLIKYVPYKAGLGIASSNAVSVLKLLNSYWECGLSLDELSKISKEIGSDCPFFFHQEVCEITGKGEQIRVLGKKPCLYPMGIFSPLQKGIPTTWAFDRIREEKFYSRYETQGKELVSKWARGLSWEELSQYCCNSFFDLLKERKGLLKETYKTLKTRDNIVQLSGSGASFFVIFQNLEKWKEFWISKQEKLKNNFDFYWTML